MAATGSIMSGLTTIIILGKKYPTLLVTPDLFTVPLILSIANKISPSSSSPHEVLATLTVAISLSLGLTGLLGMFSLKIRILNFGSFLPSQVIGGLMSVVGVGTFRLAWKISTDAITVSTKEKVLLHFLPSVIAGLLIYSLQGRSPYILPGSILFMTSMAYLFVAISADGMDLAKDRGFFWASEEFSYRFANSTSTSTSTSTSYAPPYPFGYWFTLDDINWLLVFGAGKEILSFAFLFAIRCNLHNETLVRVANDCKDKYGSGSGSGRYQNDEKGCMKSHFIGFTLSALAGGTGAIPNLSAPSLGYRLHQTGRSVQVFALLMLLPLIATEWSVVAFLPKIVFSTIMIQCGIVLLVTYFIAPWRKCPTMWDFLPIPIMVLVSIFVSIVAAVVVGGCMCVFIFAQSHMREGFVKFLSNGLYLRSSVERGVRESECLNRNGEMIQVICLHGERAKLSHVRAIFLFFPTNTSLRLFVFR